MADFPELETVDVMRRRVCRSCEAIYTISEWLRSQRSYFEQPYDYLHGCQEYCLNCWLGVGPLDIPEAYGEEPVNEPSQAHGSHEVPDEGDLLTRYAEVFGGGFHLAVMPIARVHLEWTPVTYRGLFTFFPPGMANLDALKIVDNRETSSSLAEVSSALSGITADLLQEHPLVAFPCRLDWDKLLRIGHRAHRELICELSEAVDRSCLNYVRYCLCQIDLVDTLPGRAGQVAGNPMMAGACIYNHSLREARIIGGDAFTHLITRGLGLPLESIATEEFPQQGEVGNIVEHALGLYAAVQEASSPTAKFMQVMSLLEYLAFPDEFRPFKKVRAMIVRYASRTPDRRDRLTNRLKNDLFGPVGYRTQIIHNGKRLEQLLPSPQQRKELFRELDVYMRPMIDDMVRHSELSWAEFAQHRTTIGFPSPDDED
jgi:hypothetical protein